MQAITSVRNYIEQMPPHSWTATFVMLVPIIDALFFAIKEKQWSDEKLKSLKSNDPDPKIAEYEKQNPKWKDFQPSEIEKVGIEYQEYLEKRAAYEKEVNTNANKALDITGKILLTKELANSRKSSFYIQLISIVVPSLFIKLSTTFILIYLTSSLLSTLYISKVQIPRLEEKKTSFYEKAKEIGNNASTQLIFVKHLNKFRQSLNNL